MASSTSRNHRLSRDIRKFGFLAPVPCRHCLSDFQCFIMPDISARCERCAKAGRKNCVDVSWDAVHRTVDDYRERARKEEKAELKAALRKVEDRRLAVVARCVDTARYSSWRSRGLLIRLVVWRKSWKEKRKLRLLRTLLKS